MATYIISSIISYSNISISKLYPFLNSNLYNHCSKEMQLNILILLFYSILAIVTTYTISEVRHIDAQSGVNNSCIIAGNSNPPPPFIVLRWDTSGQCNSTINHFVHFYDIRSVIINGTEYNLFLESE
jgi:hypothetical protein